MEEEKTRRRSIMKGRGNVCTYSDAACEGVECGGFLTEEFSGRHAAIYFALL
jgi:hypothetical protein